MKRQLTSCPTGTTSEVLAAPIRGRAGDARHPRVVDDQSLLRLGFRAVLEQQPDLEVVGEAADGAAVAPAVTRRLIESFAAHLPVPGGRTGVDGLTELARGRYISEGTVKVHVGRILTKLDLRDRIQVVAFAYENGIVHPGGE